MFILVNVKINFEDDTFKGEEKFNIQKFVIN